ncbi:HDOD domain-containing protein [Dissulfurirhabdus thermomarina]|uniref:HDOD domain-containing protein n=1 Tax=Dissulfurirhabdus thermomarina TaxID=1765737 RepID=A0A6N9TJ66_DISTH|nr:HDOD domain-containing protein [Dissulfurirhabdus thermomarina]NDY41295.1 HDOD domain-containing protein [Dissulfurirhabdus thermomarina]NMX23752.1 HDOD domain-containing protein [Dissulfurirhabdus thermomarina]
MARHPEDLVLGADVSSLPDIYQRISRAVDDPLSTSADIGRIISEDTGLSARLLRIVNSPFYGFPSKIETISRAVTIIGTRQLRDLALATSIVKMFEGVSSDLVDMEKFWRHSVACGVAARILGTYQRYPNVERLFVASLLHDIGRLILYLQVPQEARRALTAAREEGRLVRDVEEEVLGFDHADVGRALLKFWKLPPSLVEAVTYHHRPRRAMLFPVEAATAHLADFIVNARQLGTSGERFVPPLDADAWRTLGLSVNVLSPVLAQLERQYKDVVAMIIPVYCS